jgi:uncharacterized caspase-like protein
MTEAVDSFGKKITKADACLFYYSGHGAEFDGNNYLFPKNSNPVIPNDLVFEAFPLNKIIGKIEFSKIKTSIIILDACR